MITKPIQPFFVLNTAAKYLKAEISSGDVAHFYSFNTQNLASCNTKAVPDASIDILFHCNKNKPLANVGGCVLKAKEIHLVPNSRYFGIRFMPGIIPNFLDIIPKEITDNIISLSDFSTKFIEPIEKIAVEDNFTKQIKLFMLFFMQQSDNKANNPCSFLLHYIIQKRGIITIAELEKISGYSGRYINKLFINYIGIPAKVFSLMTRFQYALSHINQYANNNLTYLAMDLGFSDQSHFLRSFKEYAAIAPKKYIQEIQDSDYQNKIFHINNIKLSHYIN